MRRPRKIEPLWRDFDLPAVRHEVEHYKPPKATDPRVAKYRKGRPYGLLTSEYQLQGLKIAALTLEELEDPEAITFAAKYIAASGINVAWYEIARSSRDVMRRRLKLPKLDYSDPDWRPDSGVLLRSATRSLNDSAISANKVRAATEYRSVRRHDFSWELGKRVGGASLEIACIDIGDEIVGNHRLNDHDVQDLVRQKASEALQDALTMEERLGVPPSLAQLADPWSPLSVEWHRRAPHASVKALDRAQEEFAIAA